MKDLFLPKKGNIAQDSLSFQKEAEMGSHPLSADSTNWVKEIITLFLQKFPYLQEEEIDVTWTKKDNDRGYAIGSLNVLQGVVPIVINDFHMSPLDIMMFPDKRIPLTDYFLQKIYQKPTPFKGLDKGKRKIG